MTSSPSTVAVIGSGLAGLSAAIQAHEAGHVHVVLIEKEKNIGGNSMKATSGINAVEPLSNDTEQLFVQDTLQSGGGLSKANLVDKLVHESEEAVAWLKAHSNDQSLDLSVLSQCGGHSRARTHRCPPRPDGGPVPVGWKLVDTLKGHLLSLDHVKILTETRALELLKSEDQISGVKVEDGHGQREIKADAVILASGGFGGQTATTQPDQRPSLMKTYAPQFLNIATTNGPWANGDGIQLGLGVGAALRDMDQVQIHPTGFIDPQHPNASTKFLAPEALRAYGAVLLNGQGHRFADELWRRDALSKAIFDQANKVTERPHSWMTKLSLTVPAAYMVMTDEAVEGFGKSTLGFYASKGFFIKHDTVASLATQLDTDAQELQQEFKDYDEHFEKQTADAFGKTRFPCRLLPAHGTTYWVSMVTPCVHYTMGGLQIDETAQVMNDKQQPVVGLYAAGEVTGGVHGHNRLAGNSLLECVVYGRTAGRYAANHAKKSHQSPQ
ncbi:FAD binding domain-containing protein [Radiomyces spectabilis]|uniref:FAD binding domain-containing protein n=1 Tax=Radiomyces spectabilis TaxID=64574 RepID=UPI0022200B9F|nr:FAD binding domain-containing protein [Radiomyces spectabilis]KAI8376332.1 FAD binding domain-containing protein [Radiomyces spectabilis]